LRVGVEQTQIRNEVVHAAAGEERLDRRDVGSGHWLGHPEKEGRSSHDE
jgi:hypothetical protein